jgi:hypothetical protein
VAVLDPLTTAGGTTSEGEATDLEVDLQQQQVPERVNQPLPRKAPSFADQLARSLVAVNETRAWFDEARGYTHVRQSRVPTRLPQVKGGEMGVGLRYHELRYHELRYHELHAAEERRSHGPADASQMLAGLLEQQLLLSECCDVIGDHFVSASAKSALCMHLSVCPADS